MIRMLVLLVLLFSFSQRGMAQLSGTYSASTGYTAHSITFWKADSFSYRYSSCTGGSIGEGIYSRNGKHISLHFSQIPPGKFSSFHESTEDIEDSFSRYDFYVHDDRGYKMWYSVIVAFDNGTAVDGTTTDTNGRATIYCKTNKSIDSIRIDNLGFQQISIPATALVNGKRSFDVTLVSKFYTPIKQGTFGGNYLKVSGKSLVMHSNPDGDRGRLKLRHHPAPPVPGNDRNARRREE